MQSLNPKKRPAAASVNRRHQVSRQIRFAFAAILTAASSVTHAADWRVIIASDDVVIMVDAGTFRRDGQQLVFRTTAYSPKPEANGSIGNVGNLTFDCAGRRMRNEEMLDIRPDGSTAPTKDEKAGFVAIPRNSMAEVFLDRMCRIKPDGNKVNGVRVSVPPGMAAKSIFGLLKLGLDSTQSSELAALKYWDESSLLRSLESAAVPKAKQTAVRKVLFAQTVQPPPPAAPIVPLQSAVASGKVGRYTHSAHELVAGLWLRADGTFRYGMTVGSLDETAAGRWTVRGDRVELVNEPRSKPPAVTAGPGTLEAGKPLSLTLQTAAGRGVSGVDILIEFDSGDARESYTQSAGWVLPVDEKRQPHFITFAMPSYGLRPTRFPVDVNTANVLTFVFAPNDFGVVDLTGLVVDADANGLTLYRDGGSMRFDKRAQ